MALMINLLPELWDTNVLLIYSTDWLNQSTKSFGKLVSKTALWYFLIDRVFWDLYISESKPLF